MTLIGKQIDSIDVQNKALIITTTDGETFEYSFGDQDDLEMNIRNHWTLHLNEYPVTKVKTTTEIDEEKSCTHFYHKVVIHSKRGSSVWTWEKVSYN